MSKSAPVSVVVWLIEDNDAFRSVVVRVLNDIEGVQCPRAFGNCEAALAVLATESPDVILLDVGLPGMSGIAGIHEIKTLAPATHVVMLTVFDDPEKISQAIQAGAAGYLLKTASEDKIAEAIREVVAGGVPMDHTVAQCVWKLFAGARLPGGRCVTYGLTVREQEILRAVVRGLMTKEIADQLCMSYHTADTHLRRIFQKLHVHSRAAAVAKAVQEQLL
jgi:DNA-binding NarL/FixJ family response regulator